MSLAALVAEQSAELKDTQESWRLYQRYTPALRRGLEGETGDAPSSPGAGAVTACVGKAGSGLH